MTVSALRSLSDPFEQLLALEDRLRASKLDVAAGQAQFWIGLGFRMGKLWLAAPQADVREVIVPPQLTRVPGARPWLLGVANVRGSLLPVCDLRRLVGEEHHHMERASRVLVLNSDRVPAGFLVDEVAGYRQFTPSEQKHNRLDGAGVFRNFALGAFERDGRVWVALSLHKVIEGDAFKHAGW